jgi:hypothetical protein
MAGSARAEKPATFEQAMESAQPAGELSQLLEPLFAECKSDDDLEARQCASVRDWHVEQLKASTFWSLGDESALSWEPYDPVEKKQELTVQGCLACGKPITIEGKPRFVTTRVPKAIKAGHAVGLDVGFPSLEQPDSKTAEAFKKSMEPRLRVQFAWKLGPLWKSGGFDGVTFVPVGYRVFDKCSGKIVASDPPSSAPTVNDAQAMRDASCPEELSDAEKRRREEAALPEQLTPKMINQAMATVREKVLDCGSEFEQTGTATVKLVVEHDGSMEIAGISAPIDKTPAGYCIRTALKGTVFPRFRGEKMIISYPFKLR